MPRTLGRLCLALLALTAAMLWTIGTPVTADLADAPPDPLASTPIRSVFLRIPQRSAPSQSPLQVLVVLHGMGGNGPDFARDLFDQADRNGWLIVAPTIDYGDWTNPSVVAEEDPLLIQTLNDYLDSLPSIVGTPVRHLVLLLGHSRGAQLAHRFAEFRPDRVLAVAALSAGTYTLPTTAGTGGNLNFPFGVQDLDHYAGHAFDPQRFDGVAFWVGVGGQDSNPGDVPRQWDSIEGATRVQRARAFEAAARQLGASVELHIFGNARHELTAEMRSAACDFLKLRQQGAATAQQSGTDASVVDAPPY
jgi:pimeloyl-ACP methyl ester carboxylesterase